MSTSKKTALFLTAVFLFSTSVVFLADNSDADSEYSVTAYSSYHWYRTVDKVHVGNYASFGSNYIVKSADYDSEIQKYVDGTLKRSDLSSDYTGSSGDYYIYYLKNGNESYYDGSTKSMSSYECKEFSHPTSDWSFLNSGVNKLKILSISVNATEEEAKKVSIKQYGSNYYGTTLTENDTHEFYSGDKGFCFVVQGSIATKATVKFSMNNPLKVLTPGTATNEITLGTQCRWVAGEVTLSPGQYRYNSSDLVVLLQKGSEKEQQFLTEVISVGKGKVPEEYRLSGDFDISSFATYSVYRLSTNSYSSPYINLNYEDRITHAYKYVNTEGHYVTESNNHYQIFSPANKAVSVTLEYDENLYQAMWMVNSSDLNGDSAAIPLPSGYIIRNTASSACDGYVKINYIGSGNEDAMMSANLKISVEGAAEPTGAPVALIGVSIALCIIPFLLLGLSGLRPKWAK